MALPLHSSIMWSRVSIDVMKRTAKIHFPFKGCAYCERNPD